MKLNKNVLKIISLFGVIGGVFYFLHIIIGRAYYENYDPLAQAVSDLTADDSPSKQIASIFTLFYGIFTVIFSMGFFIYIRNKINKIIKNASCVFCFMEIISFVGYTLFPLSRTGSIETFQNKMHILVTILVVLSTIISLILFIIGFLKTKSYKYMGIISLCTLIILITGAMILNVVPKEYFGLAERVNVYSIIAYTGILSVWTFKYIYKDV
jgi:hypothetical membrane protein